MAPARSAASSARSCALWFGILAVLGMIQIMASAGRAGGAQPGLCGRVSVPHPWESFLALGAMVLAVTGGEALYTDMGHFGKFPIRAAWFSFVLPALVLNYYGQGALLLQSRRDPESLLSAGARTGR
jgi:KUP system potassium uptake protein